MAHKDTSPTAQIPDYDKKEVDNPGKDVDTPGQIFMVFFVVLIGLFATIAASMSGLGDKAIYVHMLISIVQVSFIGFFWMHMKKADQMTWLSAGSALFVMLILFVLPLADFLTRHRGGL
ncbi:cytochrome C oxidase subunit IV family protein [Zavarzinella formosa]|uniref:hypothetical protein n=1 Tax=Zavarzinella formosa TaxID=360055 RepID=UPI0002E16221|nr:hypothetical protein [Zavarzinella formosa]